MAYSYNRKPSALELRKRPISVPAAAPAVESKDEIIARLAETIDRLSRVDLTMPTYEIIVTERNPDGTIRTVIARPKT